VIGNKELPTDKTPPRIVTTLVIISNVSVRASKEEGWPNVQTEPDNEYPSSQIWHLSSEEQEEQFSGQLLQLIPSGSSNVPTGHCSKHFPLYKTYESSQTSHLIELEQISQFKRQLSHNKFTRAYFSLQVWQVVSPLYSWQFFAQF